LAARAFKADLKTAIGQLEEALALISEGRFTGICISDLQYGLANSLHARTFSRSREPATGGPRIAADKPALIDRSRRTTVAQLLADSRNWRQRSVYFPKRLRIQNPSGCTGKSPARRLPGGRQHPAFAQRLKKAAQLLHVARTNSKPLPRHSRPV